jgi:hypothetical protein
MPVHFTCACGNPLMVDNDQARKELVCSTCAAVEQVRSLQSPKPSFVEHKIFQPGTVPADADFFLPAPAEIGRLHSAHTSLRRSVKSRPFWLRSLFGISGGVAAAVLAVLVLYFGLKTPLETSVMLGSFLLPFFVPVALGLTLWFTQFDHYCGYVANWGWRTLPAPVRAIG